MHAVLTRLKAAPGKFDEVKAIAADLIMPAYVEDAARGAYILERCGGAELVTIVLYGTYAEAEAIEAGEAMGRLRDGWQSLLAEAPCVEMFEVLVGTTASAPGRPLSGDILALLSDLSRAL